MKTAYRITAAAALAIAGAAVAQVVPLPPGGLPKVVLPKPTSTPTEFKPIHIIVPLPVLALTGVDQFTKDGTTYRWIKYDIINKSQYPANWFTPAPDLPPCGKNANASRAWLDFFPAGSKKRIYGFCALDGTADLGKISFTVPVGQPVPASVYVTITDRKTGAVYTSNPAPTAMPGTEPAMPEIH